MIQVFSSSLITLGETKKRSAILLKPKPLSARVSLKVDFKLLLKNPTAASVRVFCSPCFAMSLIVLRRKADRKLNGRILGVNGSRRRTDDERGFTPA